MGFAGLSSSPAVFLAGADFAVFGLVSAGLSASVVSAFLLGLASEGPASGFDSTGLQGTVPHPILSLSRVRDLLCS